jgi:hypothetical protein
LGVKILYPARLSPKAESLLPSGEGEMLYYFLSPSGPFSGLFGCKNPHPAKALA